MHLYSGSSTDFIVDATRNRIAEKLSEAFFDHFRYQAPQTEVRSWQNSLRAMADAIHLADLQDNGVVVELQLPLSSKRLDCLVTGRDAGDRAQALIVELKQWDRVSASAIDDCVTTFVGGRLRDVLHPSRQVGNYERYLLDVHTAFNDGSIGLASCAYLHNLARDHAIELLGADHRELLERSPVFVGEDADHLASMLADTVGAGDGLLVLDEVLKGTYRPHKRLLDHVAQVIKREPTFVLLDEQQIVFNHILGRVRGRQRNTEQSIFVVRGGPGTGKSVIAVNLLAELAGEGFVVQHATGSRAFTNNLRQIVGTRAAPQFGFFNGFAKAEPMTFDAMICDESHRLRETSNSRFTRGEDRSDVSQVEELIQASKVSVFFIDDRQVVRPGEVGSTELIRSTAAALDVPVYEHELEAQFRCGGSEGFVGWVENTLEVTQTPYVLWDPKEEFDFDVVDSPRELESLIRGKADEGFSTRLVAGFCWPWSDPRPDGTLEPDVQIGDWSRPWNAKAEAGRLAPGIPKSNHWASDPAGLDQVGCVYTAQGFEFDYVGLIFGRDLVWRPREGWIGQSEYSHDSVVKRSARRQPDLFLDLVKNTYRVLLTRGLRGCFVYFEDDQTRDFVLSRIEWPGEE